MPSEMYVSPAFECGKMSFVHPNWRGINIAGELITRGLKHLKEHGWEEAGLEVKAQNPSSLRLYQSIGFEFIRENCSYILYLEN